MTIRLGVFALAAASALLPVCADAQDVSSDVVGTFRKICGVNAAGSTLPGNDVAAANAPPFFAGDLGRAAESHVVKIDRGFAMRAIIPSSADPVHAVLIKCAVASRGSFSDQVAGLSAILSVKPTMGKTAQNFDYAQFISGATSYAVYSEPEGWVSAYKMEIMMRNIDPRYLKKGAKPAPLPSVR